MLALTSARVAVVGPPMELKLCELGCGRTFLRPVPLNAKKGQKWCRPCGAMSPEQREAQYVDQHMREVRARAGVF
jgi:hypothetical protein